MKKFDLTRIFFLLTSILILAMAILSQKANLISTVIGALVIIALVVLDKNSAKIAKLSEANPKVKTIKLVNRLTISIVILASLYSLMPYNINSISDKTNNIILISLVSLFVMFFGNISPKIPFNRYVGLRLPWTIRDEDTWKVAHRILGYISFPIGVLMFISSFYIDIEHGGIFFILTWILVPSIYSLYFYYKKFSKFV